MINLNTEIVDLNRLSIENQSQNKSVYEKNISSTDSALTKEEFATYSNISKIALSKVSEIISKEDISIEEFNNAKKAYDYITDIRAQLKDYMQSIKNPEANLDVEELKELDKKSNELIQNILNIMSNKNFNSVIDSGFTSFILEGLTSIKSLNITNDNYYGNLRNILNTTIQKQIEYLNKKDKSYSDLMNISNKFNNLVSDYINSDNSTQLQAKIVSNPTKTLEYISESISPDIVIRLLQAH